MGIRVAFGAKSNIGTAIVQGKIPKDTIIITDEPHEAELFFYDASGNMRLISEKNRFETLSEAQAWVNTYPCVGQIISVHNGSTWLPYIVNDDNVLEPIVGGSSTIVITEVTRIDGGTSFNEIK